jgi:thiol:disulfide interchange protein DsbD
MDAVKRFFGVALLAVAIWLISPLLSEISQMLMWAALLIISAMYLHALEPLAVNARGFTRSGRGSASCPWWPASPAAGRHGRQPGSAATPDRLPGWRRRRGDAGAHLQFQRVKNLAELDAAMKGAAGRYVMLDFYADWCVSCKELERFTFADAGVRPAQGRAAAPGRRHRQQS